MRRFSSGFRPFCHPKFFGRKQRGMYHIARSVPGAGAWLLNLSEFVEWRDGNSKKLWCYGIRKITIRVHIIIDVISTNISIAGAGKTVLA